MYPVEYASLPHVHIKCVRKAALMLTVVYGHVGTQHPYPVRIMREAQCICRKYKSIVQCIYEEVFPEPGEDRKEK